MSVPVKERCRARSGFRLSDVFTLRLHCTLSAIAENIVLFLWYCLLENLIRDGLPKE